MTRATAVRVGRQLTPGYRVLGRLSRNRVLDVYDVWSTERDCRCIAKVLRPECAGDDKALRMLLREGRLLQRLTHPHIVRCYELVRAPRPAVILETLSGETLSHAVTNGPRLRVDDLAMLGVQLTSAVQYLHRRTRMLHLDLKPSNIIVEHGRTKLIDFSVSRRPGAGHRGAGTRQFMSPEQARGARVTEATDVWGIGAVLFSAAAGRPPFHAQRDGGHEQLSRRAEPLRRFRRLPAEFTDLVDACLEPEPRQRPTAAGVTRTLNTFI